MPGCGRTSFRQTKGNGWASVTESRTAAAPCNGGDAGAKGIHALNSAPQLKQRA
jgi:hypothetical protein